MRDRTRAPSRPTAPGAAPPESPRAESPPPESRPADRPPRPAEICRLLLAALDAAEGRRRRRKRDTTPDAIGLSIKRTLLEEAVRADPDPAAFEGWLLDRCTSAGSRAGAPGGPPAASGPVRAMALDLLGEWRLAQTSPAFRDWLGRGAPSDDAEGARCDANPHPASSPRAARGRGPRR